MNDSARSELSKIDASLKQVSSSIDKIAGIQKRAPEKEGARKAIDVDALTEAEVDELKALISVEDPISYSFAKISEDASYAGMYSELSRLGLVLLDADGSVFLVTKNANWAVEKSAQRVAEREADVARQEAHDRKMTLIAAAAGLVGAIIGAVLTVALTYWLLPK